MTTLEQFRRLFAYEQFAHARMIESLRAAAPAHGAKDEFRQALRLAEHLVAARLIWLGRFGQFDGAPTTWFPDEIRTVDEVDSAFARMHAIWSRFLARVDDAELARVFEYQSLTDDGRFTDAVGYFVSAVRPLLLPSRSSRIAASSHGRRARAN